MHALARTIAEQLERRCFDGQDDYEPWTPAFREFVASTINAEIVAAELRRPATEIVRVR